VDSILDADLQQVLGMDVKDFMLWEVYHLGVF
jgi:hypothetical protein